MGNVLNSAGNAEQAVRTSVTREVHFRHGQRLATLRTCPRTAEALQQSCSLLCKELCIDEEKEQLLGFSVDAFGPVLPLFLLPRLRPRPQPYFCVVSPRRQQQHGHTCPPVAQPLALSSLLPYRRRDCILRQGYDTQALPAAQALFSQLQCHGYAVLLVDDDHGTDPSCIMAAEGHGGRVTCVASAGQSPMAAGPPAVALHAGGHMHLHAHAQALHHAAALLSAPPAVTSQLVLSAPQHSKLVGYPRAPGKGRQFYQVRRCSLPLPLPEQAKPQIETPGMPGDDPAVHSAAVEQQAGRGPQTAQPSAVTQALQHAAVGRDSHSSCNSSPQRCDEPQISCRQAIQQAFDFAEDVAERCMFAVAAVLGWDPLWVSSLLDPQGALPWQEGAQLGALPSAVQPPADQATAQATQGACQLKLSEGAVVEGAAGDRQPASGAHVQPSQASASRRQLKQGKGATTNTSLGSLWQGACCSCCAAFEHDAAGQVHQPTQQAPPVHSRTLPAGASAQYGSNVMRWYRYLRPVGVPPPTLTGGPQGHFHATGVHTDLGFITVAMRASLPGLRVLHPATLQFQDVETDVRADAYIVFAGEQLAGLTRGALQAAVHFVEESFIGQPRYSSPFFLRPRPSAVIWPTQVHLSAQFKTSANLQGLEEAHASCKQAGKGNQLAPVPSYCPWQALKRDSMAEPPLMTALFAPGEPITAAAFAQRVMMTQRPWNAGYNTDF